MSGRFGSDGRLKVDIGSTMAALAISASGSSVSSGTVVFSNSNNVSFGQSGSTVTASASFAGGSGGIVVSGGTLSSSTISSLVFSDANNVSFGFDGTNITATAAAGTATPVAISAGTQSGNTGAILFADSNGITFGMSGSTRVTASHNGLTSQSNQALSGSNGSFTFQTATFGNANAFSFLTSNGSMVGSYTVPSTAGLISAVNVSAGTTSDNLSAVTFADSNGIAFGLDAGTITASHNGLTSQSNQALSGSNGSFTFQTATFGNANGLSFLTSNGSLVGSYTVPTVPSVHNVTLSGNSTSAGAGFIEISSGTWTLAGGNNITLSQNGNAVTISGANAGGVQTGISGIANSETTYTSGTVSFSELGAITIRSTTGNQFQFSVNAQSAQTGISGIANSETTYTSGTVSFSELGAITIRSTTGNQYQFSVAAQTAQTGISAIQVSDATYTSGTVNFSNGNGISFGSSGANVVTASYTRPVVSNAIQTVGSATNSGTNTSRFAADDHVHAGVFSVGVSTGGNSAGNTRVDVGRFVFEGGNSVTLSQATAANALNTIVIAGQTGLQFTSNTSAITSNALHTSSPRVFHIVAATDTAGGGTSSLSSNVSFSNANAFTFYTSAGNAIALSQGVEFYLYGDTFVASRSTLDPRSFSISGLENLNLGFIGGALVLDAIPAMPASAGTDATRQIGGITLRNSNNISFGFLANIGSTQRITASYHFHVSAGTTATSVNEISLADSNGVYFGVDGATVTANAGYLSYFENAPFLHQTISHSMGGGSTSYVHPFIMPLPGSFSYIRMPISMSLTSTSYPFGTTGTYSAKMRTTYFAVVYSLGVGASSQSLQSVASGSCPMGMDMTVSVSANSSRHSVTHNLTYGTEGGTTSFATNYSTSTNSATVSIHTTHLSNFTGYHYLDIPFPNSLSAGAYWIATGWSSTTSTQSIAGLTGASFTSTMWGITQPNLVIGNFGVATASSNAIQPGVGSFTTNAIGTTASIPLSAICSSASHLRPPFQMIRQA